MKVYRLFCSAKVLNTGYKLGICTGPVSKTCPNLEKLSPFDVIRVTADVAVISEHSCLVCVEPITVAADAAVTEADFSNDFLRSF